MGEEYIGNHIYFTFSSPDDVVSNQLCPKISTLWGILWLTTLLKTAIQADLVQGSYDVFTKSLKGLYLAGRNEEIFIPNLLDES